MLIDFLSVLKKYKFQPNFDERVLQLPWEVASEHQDAIYSQTSHQPMMEPLSKASSSKGCSRLETMGICLPLTNNNYSLGQGGPSELTKRAKRTYKAKLH